MPRIVAEVSDEPTDRERHPAPPVVFTPSNPSAPPAADLLRAMTAELDVLYPQFVSDQVSPVDPSEMVPPGGAYLVGRVDGHVVAGGGLRPLPGGDHAGDHHMARIAEIKRMFVEPRWRRRGIAGALLHALEEAAAELGYDVVRLDTGPRQPYARRLYELSGYRPIPCYNTNRRATYWGEKRIVPPAHAGSPSL